MATTGGLEYDDFAGRTGEAFVVDLPDGAQVTLVLAEATQGTQPGGAGADGTARTQFSLVFSGPAAPALPQATWELTHDGLGAITLFLVPIGPGSYEAAFA